MDEKLIRCMCHSPEHQLIIDYDEEDNIAYIEYHLCPLPFFQRIKHAAKYIFGHRSIYGDFDEVLVDKEYADYFIELGTKLKENAPQ
jgi:hypothetical protein